MPSGVPYAVDFAPLFNDNTTLYFYNPENTNSDTIWTYNVSTSSWKEVQVSNAADNPPAPKPGGWVSTAGIGKSFYMGTPDDALSGRDTTVPNPGLQILDTTTTPPAWKAGIQGGPLLSSAEVVYVRSGKQGVLIAFGGVDPNSHQQFADQNLGDYRDMSDIYVYDIDSSQWFTVTATGSVPAPRISFCAGVSSAPDDTSFQITIYGGYNLHAGNPANDIYVLSIPSFQWIDVTPKNMDQYGRWQHDCVVWQDAQMLVLGGLIKEAMGNGPVVNANGCNSSHPPFSVIDLESFTFQTTFNTQRSYSVPQAVYNVIGGDYRGLSGMKGPKGGFNNAQLTQIFATTIPRDVQPTSFPPVPTATPTTPASSAVTSLANSSTNSGGLSTGAIAGIAVGVGLIALLAIAGAVFYIFKRRKSRDGPISIDEATDIKDKDSHGNAAGSYRRHKGINEADGRGLHEADGYQLNELGESQYVYEADGSRISELQGFQHLMEAGGRELSREEAEAYMNRKRSR
jgi:hypothetical protein